MINILCTPGDIRKCVLYALCIKHLKLINMQLQVQSKFEYNCNIFALSSQGQLDTHQSSPL